MPRPDRSRPFGRKIRPSVSRGLIAAGFSLLLCGAASAQAPRPSGTADIDLRIGGGYSDNIRRSQTAQQSASYDFVGLSFDYFRDGGRVSADLLGDIEQRSYSQSTLSNEPVGSITAAVDADLVRNVLSWFVRDSYSQGRTNVFRAAGPGNRQEINVFSTGPRVQATLGSRTFLRGTATKSSSNFSSSTRLDADRLNYEIGLYRAVSSTTEIGIGGSRIETDFDDSPVESRITSYFVSYQRELARGSANVQVGKTKSDFDGVETDSPTYQVGWSRGVGSRSRVSINAEHGITDYTDAFLRGNAGTTVSPGPSDIILVRNTYEYSNLSLNYTLSMERGGLSVGLGAGESQYLQSSAVSGFTNDNRSLNFSFNRTIRPRLQFQFLTRVFERRYSQLGSKQTSVNSSVTLTKQFARRFQLAIGLRRESQTGMSGFNFDENVARVSINIDLNP